MGYALPTSRKYLAWYMQQQRKKRQAASEPTAVQRFFTGLNSTLTQYYAIPTWTAAGDFDITLDWERRDISQVNLLGQAASAANRLSVNSTASASPDTVFLLINGVVRQWTGALAGISYGTLVTIRAKRYADNTVELWVAGVSVGVTAAISGTFTVDTLGQGNSTQYVSGVYANVGLDNLSGDNRFYALDEDLSTTSVIKNSLATLGSELVVNGDFSNGTTDWVPISSTNLSVVDGELRVEALGTFRSATQSFSTIIGKRYLFKADLSRLSGTGYIEARPTDGAGTNYLSFSQRAVNSPIQNTLEYIITATDTVMDIYLQVNDNGSIGVFDNISVKQADGYGTAINIAESTLFTEVADGWEGVDVSTLKNVTSSGSEGIFTVIQTNSPATPTTTGAVYRITDDVVGLTSGELSWTSAGSAVNRSMDGETVTDIIAASGTTVVRTAGVQPNSGSSMSLTIKQFLEVA